MDTAKGSLTAGWGMAFVQGAVCGAVIGLLLAPRSGKETRKQLKEYAQKARNNFQRAAAKGREAMREFADTGRQAVQHAASAVQNEISHDRTQPFKKSI